MTRSVRFAVKILWALWMVLRLGFWLFSTVTRLTFGLAWRQTFGRSTVYVRRDWDDRGMGRVRWSDLHGHRWDTTAGGTQVENPLPLIHAYIWCDKVRGKIGHSCAHGEGPHNIKVCMLRQDNTRRNWRRLLELAGPDRRLAD
ncbi:MAG: hypothetical protein O3A93_09425 [Chloroflexi bacterium]|nr:hypothetical protein [Chloroflexota bacterium]MDA1271466.1 hypothetical protein [Chloroflexota bacterium]PKB58626.1 MAG: hypothetical protein BZY83_06115 [SAR202 cluster bacterium Casp-Chloro-G2]